MIPIVSFTTNGKGSDVTHIVQSHTVVTVGSPAEGWKPAYSVLPLCAGDVQVVQGIEYVVDLQEFLGCTRPCPECSADYRKRRTERE